MSPESEIPNVEGYRKDVLDALFELKVPVMRWPGGCFADKYHWRDGIGPREDRPRMVNNNWGGTVEDNSFGTHEFLNRCEMIGCEPYISGNVGSGTVEELAKWVEYMTAADGDKLVLTPTYHTFRMYNVHQNAMYLPVTCDSPKFTDANGRECTFVDATASRNSEGAVNITLTNTHLDETAELTLDLGSNAYKVIEAEILTSADARDCNKFDKPDNVKPVEFKDFKIKGGKVIVKMPALSIVSLSLEN